MDVDDEKFGTWGEAFGVCYTVPENPATPPVFTSGRGKESYASNSRPKNKE